MCSEEVLFGNYPGEKAKEDVLRRSYADLAQVRGCRRRPAAGGLGKNVPTTFQSPEREKLRC